MDSFKQAPVTHLLNQIHENTAKYLTFLSAQSLPEPSFENGEGIPQGQRIPIDVQTARDAAIEAAGELRLILLGPLALVMSSQADQFLMLAMQYISGLPLKDVTRFFRLAASRRVFREVSKGAIEHTTASQELIHNPKLVAWLMNIADEFWLALARIVDATDRWPGSEEPNESGYSLGHSTCDNVFDVIKHSPERQQRYMDVIGYLLQGYDSSKVRVLVDIGGAHGEVAIALAQKYQSMEIVVQDKKEVIQGLGEHVPATLKDRIHGMEHDFFTTQPVRDADVYLFRWVFHCWSDKYCVKILQSLVPSLKRGSKIVINDLCIHEPGGSSLSAARESLEMDIMMMAFNNACERDTETWEMLFETADPGFKFFGIKMPARARMAIIEAEWEM
ncbi:putative hydroxyindole O-methyltransferase [Daldinia bambusicola]|nr:putative hydroxyindole O-methyltransferase [Daldinia bambusicola]